MNLFKKILSDSSGVTAIEYAVIGAVVLTALVGIGLGTGITDVFSDLDTALGEFRPDQD